MQRRSATCRRVCEPKRAGANLVAQPAGAQRRSSRGACAGATATPRRVNTRASAARAAAAEHNAACWLLLLDDDLLSRVLDELQAVDLARLAAVCAFFGRPAPGQSRSLVASCAARRVPRPVAEMPPFFGTLSALAQLHTVEQRTAPLTPRAVRAGLWLRVRADAAAVQRLCEPTPEEEPAAAAPAVADAAPPAPPPRAYVGWNARMGDTLGRCYPVLGDVDAVSWDAPVVGLRVPRGWACVSPPFGAPHHCRAPCISGWYFPLAALERV